MRKLITILILFMFAFNVGTLESYAAKKKKSSHEKNVALNYETTDGFAMTATLYYPVEKKKKYPLVVMLHSLGYSSQYWDVLPYLCTKAGFAVLTVDLRGHGKSNHNIDYKMKSWQYLSLKSFSRYPNDVKEITEYIFQNYKDIEKNAYAFIGADIGANTAILTTKEMKIKPFAMVLVSPLRTFKGLYTPITMADNGAIPILAIASENDKLCYRELFELKKYAQGTYDILTYPQGGTGVMLIKRNPDAEYTITNWLVAKLSTIKIPETPTEPKEKKKTKQDKKEK